MNAIVAISEDWGIGQNNQLLFHISADLKRFRTLTTGKTVVMGHHTLLALPGGKPLPNRQNVVISSHPLQVEGVTVLHSVEQFKDWMQQQNTDDVMLIGGASLYAQLLGHCKRIYLTKVFASPEPDCFFPNLDKMENWKIESLSDIMEEKGLRFQFIDYVNTAL